MNFLLTLAYLTFLIFPSAVTLLSGSRERRSVALRQAFWLNALALILIPLLLGARFKGEASGGAGVVFIAICVVPSALGWLAALVVRLFLGKLA